MAPSIRHQVYIETDTTRDVAQGTRWVALKCDGEILYSKLMYDTNPQGVRTEKQAVKNFINHLNWKLNRLLNSEDYA